MGIFADALSFMAGKRKRLGSYLCLAVDLSSTWARMVNSRKPSHAQSL